MKKVVIGCAIAAAVPVVLLIAGSAFMASWVKKNMPDTEELNAANTEMTELHGTKEDFIPQLADGLESERIETFLRVRESLVEQRAEIASGLSDVLSLVPQGEQDDRNFFTKITDGIRLARTGMGLVGPGMEFMLVHTRQLLEAGMGEGEYVFLYSLMTYSWLEWDPIEDIGEELFQMAHLDTDEVETIRDQYGRLLIRQLRNERRALQDQPDRTPAEDALLERVEVAIDQRGLAGFPFVGNMPPEWLSTLEPYRERYRATLPQTPAEFLLDAASLLDDKETDGINIQFNSPGS